MFLEGTLYIFLIYLAILVVVVSFPFFFKNQFNSLINFFDKKEFQSRKLSYILLGFGIGFIISSCFMISLYNEHMFFTLKGWFGFHLFAIFAFTLLPVGIGLICGYGLIRNTDSIPRGTFFLFLLCFLCFGFAGTNLHDVLWCGTRTAWFTISWPVGYDLDLWMNFFQCPIDDYRVFGFYMGFQVVIFCVYSFVNLWRYFGTLPRATRQLRIKLALLISLVIGGLGVTIYIFDYPDIFGPAITIITVWVLIPLIAFPSYFIGKYFQQLNQIHLNSSQKQ